MSDLMSGLMLIFLLISVSFMLKVDAEKKKIEEVAKEYSAAQKEIHKELKSKLESKLKELGAVILDDNTIRFNDGASLFQQGKSSLNSKFKLAINSFFPLYVEVLHAFESDISEIRIEGHTSSDWTGATKLKDIYLNNAHLSQNRAFAVLKQSFNAIETTSKVKQKWLTRVFRANGVAFAKPILKKDKTEDKEKTRRVEFRVILTSDERMKKIISKLSSSKKPAK
jgi:outer membrane protein OmpA-like peptidoglycan-associated protein